MFKKIGFATLALFSLQLSACNATKNGASDLESFKSSSKGSGVIHLHCTQFAKTDIVGTADGILNITEKTSEGYRVMGRVDLTTQLPGEDKLKLVGTFNGIFIPPSRTEHFRTNYLSAKITGAEPIIDASISFWPETEDFPTSALYRDDGYRFGMDCSKSDISLR